MDVIATKAGEDSKRVEKSYSRLCIPKNSANPTEREMPTGKNRANGLPYHPSILLNELNLRGKGQTDYSLRPNYKSDISLLHVAYSPRHVLS